MPTETQDELLSLLAALDNPHRLRVVRALHAGPMHVSELARHLGISRPLLYMHLSKLEAAGLVFGEMRLEGGTAMKYLNLTAFDERLTPGRIAATEDLND